jgi:hypothetical protein
VEDEENLDPIISSRRQMTLLKRLINARFGRRGGNEEKLLSPGWKLQGANQLKAAKSNLTRFAWGKPTREQLLICYYHSFAWREMKSCNNERTERWRSGEWETIEKKGSKEEEARETLSPLFSVFLALLSAFLG